MEWLTTWFLIFMVYAFAGWLLEVIVSVFIRRKLINRGFLIGPICPIYGIGAVIFSWVFQDVNNIVALFCACMVTGVVIEYIVSYVMEKLFHVRWWDYSEQTFNVNGRVSTWSAALFGTGGALIVKFATPFLLENVALMSDFARNLTTLLLAIALIVDIATSFRLILGFRVTVGTVGKDATEEISERVREILMQKGYLTRRFYKAFPNLAPQHTKTPRRKSRPTSDQAQKSQNCPE